MYVCTYLCIYVCMYVCMLCMYVCMYACVHAAKVYFLSSGSQQLKARPVEGQSQDDSRSLQEEALALRLRFLGVGGVGGLRLPLNPQP